MAGVLYDHLFNTGSSLSKIKDAALGGTLFHLDVTGDLASTGVPGRSSGMEGTVLRSFSPAPSAN
jgi:hypothetical protein